LNKSRSQSHLFVENKKAKKWYDASDSYDLKSKKQWVDVSKSQPKSQSKSKPNCISSFKHTDIKPGKKSEFTSTIKPKTDSKLDKKPQDLLKSISKTKSQYLKPTTQHKIDTTSKKNIIDKSKKQDHSCKSKKKQPELKKKWYEDSQKSKKRLFFG